MHLGAERGKMIWAATASRVTVNKAGPLFSVHNSGYCQVI